MPEPRKILIVDDDEEIVKMLNLRLTQEGYDTRTANDANQAVSVAHKYRPDLILLDIAMPAGSGVDVMKKLAISTHTNGIPVIIVSAFPEDMNLFEGVEAIKSYIRKPFEMSDLLDTVNNVLAS
jgi:DNA-binding response OmpR family regulator